MPNERFEWLEIPTDADLQPETQKTKPTETVMGKRCPSCGWLDDETATRCFRCGHRYNLDQKMAQRIAELGVSLPPRLIEADQGLETFFRIHGRTHAPGPLALYRLRLQAEALRLSRGFDRAHLPGRHCRGPLRAPVGDRPAAPCGTCGAGRSWPTRWGWARPSKPASS